MAAFPKEFVEIVRAVFGGRAQQVLDALEGGESVTAVRANPAKISASDLRSRFASAAEDVPWRGDAFYLSERPVFSLDPLLHAGAYYVQDPAARFVGSVADAVISAENRPLRVLDLCAAPGGKSTCLAAALSSDDLLVANEVIGSRAGILAENLVKWGPFNSVVTNADPKNIGSAYLSFDIILADVPCSGEGMFRKDAGALAEWSPENVNLCAQRQRRIVADVWDSLAEGGWLIYSTCTFNSSENDGNVEWICRELGAEIVPVKGAPNSGGSLLAEELLSLTLATSLPQSATSSLRDNYQLAGPSRYMTPRVETSSASNCRPAWGAMPTKYGLQFAPGITMGEGQYVAVMRKISPAKTSKQGKASKPSKGVPCSWALPDMNCVEVETSAGRMLKAYPAALESAIHQIEASLRTIRSGVAVASVKSRDLVPQADLALSQAFNPGAFPQVALTRDQALQFLRCEALQLPDAPKGFLTVTFDNLPLGFVKNLGTRANNLFPQAWRLRM